MKDFIKNVDYAIKKYLLMANHQNNTNSIQKNKNIFRVIERNFKQSVIIYLDKELLLENEMNTNGDYRFCLTYIEEINNTTVKTQYFITNNIKKIIRRELDGFTVEISKHDYKFLEENSYFVWEGLLNILIEKNKNLVKDFINE